MSTDSLLGIIVLLLLLILRTLNDISGQLKDRFEKKQDAQEKGPE
jgi:hypothetical protein